MKHLGDITKIHGGEIEPVDCIAFGSPCQDLSVAGKHAGLEGERSGLFIEAVRIIKEMRRKTNGLYPTFAVWENVPGALSSNKGEDFRVVLEELARCACPWAAVPGPPGGKWRPAGCILGDGWSLAWRIHDAQFWGVPQRRRRIALVLDFGGHRAPEILFERQGVPGNLAAGRWAWQASAGCFVPCAVVPDQAQPRGDGVGAGAVYPQAVRSLTARNDGSPCADRGPDVVAYILRMRAGCGGGGKGPLVQEDVSGNLTAHNDQYLFRAAAFSAGQGKRAGSIGYAEELAPTMRAADGGTNRTPCVCIQGNTIDRAAKQNGLGAQEELAYTLDAADRHAVACMVFGKAGRPHSAEDGQAWTATETANALNTFDRGAGRENELVCYTKKRFGEYAEGIGTMTAGTGTKHTGENLVCAAVRKVLWFVRRLTTTECCRLQGYPDGWCDIPPTMVNGRLVKYSDTAAYRAYGNSIALPFWAWMMERMARYLPGGATLGSLFDGIGGFPLIWERIHGKGTACWASEIEPFCVAVTMHRFSEGGQDGPNP